MDNLYYLSAFVPIIVELKWLINPIAATRSSQRYFELSEQFKGKKWADYSQEYKSKIILGTLNIFYAMWLFFGLLSPHPYLFLLIIFLKFIVFGILKKLFEFSLMYSILGWINALIGFVFAVYIITNHYDLSTKVDI